MCFGEAGGIMDKGKELEYQNRIEFLENQVDFLQKANEEMKNSSSWKLTQPLRMVMIKFAALKNFFVFLKLVKKEGLKRSLQIRRLKATKKIPAGFFDLPEKDCEAYRNQSYAKDVRITVLIDEDMGGYSKEVLSRFRESVENQFYRNIEITEVNSKQEMQITGDYVLAISPSVRLEKNMVSELVQVIIEKEPMMIYTDSIQAEKDSGAVMDTEFKPDFSLHMLENYNYIGMAACIKKDAYLRLKKDRQLPESAYYYDLLLQLAEWQENENIVHIPKVLYYLDGEGALTGEDDFAMEEHTISVLQNHFGRMGKQVELETGQAAGTFHVKYGLAGNPLVSILIPTSDHVEDLQKCITSILEKSAYHNYEIIVIENNSKAEKTFRYYEEIKKNPRIKVIYWEAGFNYSAINNFGEKHAEGEYLLLLNNDVEVITPSWIEEMLMYAQQREVGAVGAKLYFPDDTIQHAGVILGIRGLAGHGHRGFARNADGYMKRLKIVQEYTVVTAACLLVERKKFQEVQGFEEELAVDFNDVDFCMKLRKCGYENIYTPYAQMYHYESKSRGLNQTKEKLERVEREYGYFKIKWRKELLKRDPYYNPNLTLEEDDFFINMDMDGATL